MCRSSRRSLQSVPKLRNVLPSIDGTSNNCTRSNRKSLEPGSFIAFHSRVPSVNSKVFILTVLAWARREPSGRCGYLSHRQSDLFRGRQGVTGPTCRPARASNVRTTSKLTRAAVVHNSSALQKRTLRKGSLHIARPPFLNWGGIEEWLIISVASRNRFRRIGASSQSRDCWSG